MPFILFIAAIFLGTDAADKLNTPHPLPVAWFEAGLTVVVVIAAVIMWFVDRD